MSDIDFTPEEISIIDKNLGFIVFNWAQHLISHILNQARQRGVSVVYMNTSETVDSGNTSEDKKDYFYERLPPQLGFRLEKVNLRGRGKEKLWAYHLDVIDASSFVDFIKVASDMIALENIPAKYVGAFIGIIGRKDSYTKEEVKRVIEIVENSRKGKEKSLKSLSKFYYDWDSKRWDGSQRFSNAVEMVVLQKMPSELQSYINNNPALLKFWAFLLSPTKHFNDPDTIGFALVSPISSKIWVINEVQTDCLNAYMEIRNKYYKGNEGNKKGMSWETMRDILHANNRSKWVSKFESNDALREKLLSNPGIVQNLPDDTQDIDKWIEEHGGADLNLLGHFVGAVNFNTRIFKLY